MKPLRNILLLLSYITAVLSIVITFVLYTKIIWIPIIALLFVAIAYFIVKTERRHSRGPAIVSVIALVLTLVIPQVLQEENVIDDDFDKVVESSEQESIEEIEDLVEQGVLEIDESQVDDNQNLDEDSVENTPEETANQDTDIVETVTPEEAAVTEVDDRGLAAPEWE